MVRYASVRGCSISASYSILGLNFPRYASLVRRFFVVFPYRPEIEPRSGWYEIACLLIEIDGWFDIRWLVRICTDAGTDGHIVCTPEKYESVMVYTDKKFIEYYNIMVLKIIL